MLVQINSPCDGTCQLDMDLGLCVGCLRTPNEVCEWPYLNHQERGSILDMIVNRKKGIEAGLK